MPKTVQELELQLWKRGITSGVSTAYWPYGHEFGGTPIFDLDAEYIEGWVARSEAGDEVVFNLDHPRVSVSGDEIIVRKYRDA